MKVDGKLNYMFGLPSVHWINNVKNGHTNSKKVILFAKNSVNFLLWSGEGRIELRKLHLVQILERGAGYVEENHEVTCRITDIYHRTVYSYAEDKSIFRNEIIEIHKAGKMTAYVWQFYRKCIGLRRTDYKFLILDLTYCEEDLGETILDENAIIRINLARHFGYLHLLSTFVHELAHFLENKFFEEDHGNTFYCLGMTLLNILQCSDIDLTEFGISRTDIKNLEISII